MYQEKIPTYKEIKAELFQKLQFLEHENVKDFDKYNQMIENTIKKVDNLSNKNLDINDNDRYILINLTKLYENSCYVNLRRFIIENSIYIPTDDKEKSVFKHNEKHYKENLQIKPEKGLVEFVKKVNNTELNSEYYHFFLYCRDKLADKDDVFEKDEIVLKVSIYTSYVSSGYTGGNCWNNDEPYYFENDRDEDYDTIFFLPKILSKTKTDLTEEDYIKLEDDIKKEIAETYCHIEEYYGNSRNHKIHYIEISDLYDILKEHNIPLHTFMPEKAPEKVRKIDELKNTKKSKIQP